MALCLRSKRSGVRFTVSLLRFQRFVISCFQVRYCWSDATNQPEDQQMHISIFIYHFLNTPCFYYKITQFRMMIRRLKRGRALRSGECNLGMLQKTAFVFPRVWLTADGHTLSSEWLCHDTLQMNIDECDNKIQKKNFHKNVHIDGYMRVSIVMC